jgi:hypothetical protein
LTAIGVFVSRGLRIENGKEGLSGEMGYTFLVDTLSAVGFNLCLSSRRRDLDDYMDAGKRY